MKVILALALFALAVFALEVQVPIILLYDGDCTLYGNSSGLICRGSATSEKITTRIDAMKGASTDVMKQPGAHSINFGNATFINKYTYSVYGNVTYGLFDEHTIYFSSLSGFCTPTCDDPHALFVDSGIVKGGRGIFANSSGSYSAVAQPNPAGAGKRFWFNALININK